MTVPTGGDGAAGPGEFCGASHRCRPGGQPLTARRGGQGLSVLLAVPALDVPAPRGYVSDMSAAAGTPQRNPDDNPRHPPEWFEGISTTAPSYPYHGPVTVPIREGDPIRASMISWDWSREELP